MARRLLFLSPVNPISGRRFLMRWLPVPILLVGSAASWMLAQGPASGIPRTEAPPAPLVDIVEVEPREVRVAITSQGLVQPRTEIDLAAQVDGQIRSLAPGLSTGGLFAEGDILAVIDARDAELALERAEAALARSEVATQRAQAQRDRLQSLAASDIASRARLEDSEHEVHLAQAQQREAHAAREQMRIDLQRTRVRAPFTGRTRAKLVGVGQVVARGTPLARIYAMDYAEVRLPIPGSDFALIDLPESDEAVDEDGPVVRLRTEIGGRSIEWRGRIVRAEGQIDPRSRMHHIVVRVEDPFGSRGVRDPAPLTAGLFVQAEIPGRSFGGVVPLPHAALRGTSQVLVLDEHDKLENRDVDILHIERDRVLVSSGLTRGERVSISPVWTEAGIAVQPRTRSDAGALR